MKSPAAKIAALKIAVAALSPEEFVAIKDAYYKAVEGLAALTEALECAGFEHEHAAAVAAEKAMDGCRLGAVV